MVKAVSVMPDAAAILAVKWRWEYQSVCPQLLVRGRLADLFYRE